MMTRLLISTALVCGALAAPLCFAQTSPPPTPTPTPTPTQNIQTEATVSHAVPADVLARLKSAYGGQKLEALRSVSLESDRRLAWQGQGQTADFIEYATDRYIKNFDLMKEQGSVETWIKQNGNVYHNRTIVNDDGAASANYFQKTYNTSDTGRYFQFFASYYRMSDLLLAHHLVTDDAQARFVKSEFYNGHMHDVIGLKFDENPLEAFIYISQKDGRIYRLVMAREIGDVNIIFGGHAKVKGLTYARENQVFVGNRLVEYEFDQKLRVNKSVGRYLTLESSLSPRPTQVDNSNMTVDELAPGVFLVGQEDYSLFVEHNGGYIAVNAYAGVKQRYDALIADRGTSLPLSSLIVTHHHSDHVEGVTDAHELGVKLWVTSETDTVLKTAPEFSEFEFVTQVLKDQQSVGPLTIYVRPTSHAAENAFVYHAGGKLLFQDDHYSGLIEEGPTWVQPTAYEMHGIIRDIGLDVDHLLSGHTRKAESWSEFEKGIKATFANNLCPDGRRICVDLM